MNRYRNPDLASCVDTVTSLFGILSRPQALRAFPLQKLPQLVPKPRVNEVRARWQGSHFSSRWIPDNCPQTRAADFGLAHGFLWCVYTKDWPPEHFPQLS